MNAEKKQIWKILRVIFSKGINLRTRLQILSTQRSNYTANQKYAHT